MDYRVGFTRVSANAKTGPIPVSTTESSTCPPTCGVRNECYAKFGHLKMHWDAVNSGKRGMPWEDFCNTIKALPKKQLWRHNQAGDLPGDGVTIDRKALMQLVSANNKRMGFTYTHYPMTSVENIQCVEDANAKGFTINVSCDDLSECDKMRDIIDAPLVVVLPSTETRKAFTTSSGVKVVVCPATYRDDVQCINCEICQSPTRAAVIGFPSHGTKKRLIDERLRNDQH